MRQLGMLLASLLWVSVAWAQTTTTIYEHTTTITDSQIKALPTTAVEVVPAAGAGKAILVWKATARLRSTTGYTVDVNASWVLMGAGGGYVTTPMSIQALVESPTTDRLFFFVAPDIFSDSSGAFTGMPSRSGSLQTSLLDNQAIVIKDDWWGVSDYTGGDSANTLTVTVYYLVVDL